MKTKEPLFPQRDGFSTVVPDRQVDTSAIRAIATQDHDAIRRWAARHHAEPATGEETASGPATTLHVHDGGTLVRFNFPAAARFRPIAWEEWFEHFDRLRLVFVYEEEVVDRAYQLWQAHQGEHGHNLEDWVEAERELGGPAGAPSARYRFMTQEEHQEGT